MTDSSEFSALKDRMKAMWMAGDFGQIARLNQRGAEEFVDRLDLKPGLRVLDVATGGGDVPIHLWSKARRAGLDLRIAGCDRNPSAVEFACRRAAEGLQAVLRDNPTSAERVVETGERGGGGDLTLVIDAAAEDAVFSELDGLHRDRSDSACGSRRRSSGPAACRAAW